MINDKDRSSGGRLAGAKWRVRSLLATFCIGAVAIAAYAGQSASAASSTGAPIKVGAVLELTGSLAKNGAELKHGYDLWAKTVNAQGGVEYGGSKHLVQLKYYDDQSDPTTAGTLIQRMVTQDGIKLSFGPASSDVVQVTSAVAERNGVLTIQSNTANSLFNRGLKLLVSINGPATTAFNPVVDLAHQRGAKTIAILALDSAFPLLQRQGIAARAKKDGMKVVYSQTFPMGTQDFSTEIDAMKAKHPDVVLFSSYEDDTINFRRQLAQLKFAPKMIAETTGPEFPDYTTALGGIANCVYGYALWNPSYNFHGPLFGSAAKFAKLYQRTYHEAPSPQAADAAAMGTLLDQGITAANSVDPIAIRKVLRNRTFQTVVGPYKDKGNGVNALASTAALQILNKQIKVVYPKSLAQAKAKYPASACYG